MSPNDHSATTTSGEKSQLPSAPEATAPCVGLSASNEARDATDEEVQTLRHVIDQLPRKVWIALLASGAERFTYYVISTPWREYLIISKMAPQTQRIDVHVAENYMQNAPGDSAVPGALGLGQSRATTIFNAYYMFSFLTPIPFALLSDAWIGRYKVLCISLRYTPSRMLQDVYILTACSLYLCGTLIQFLTSLPALFDREAGVAGLAVSMVLIGLGVGGTKATFTPFIGIVLDTNESLLPERTVADTDNRRPVPTQDPTSQDSTKRRACGHRPDADFTIHIQRLLLVSGSPSTRRGTELTM
jgi:hypothetical protein